MAVLQSQLRLSLIDQVSGRMGRIGKALAQFKAQTSRNLLAPVSGTIGRMAALGGAYLGVTTGMSGTIGAARDQQSALTEIGIKAGMTDGAINQLRVSMTRLAPRVNQTTSELLKGVDTMVTMGLSSEQAAAAMPAIGKTATATMSAIDDLSAASVSAMQNFNVMPGEIAKMLDGMAEAGNQGAFEMRDMAKAFPGLTASAASLGMDGVDGILDMAAALQVARRGAGDASTAANNMANFMQKIMSPEVAKRFKKFGVDTTKELQKAHKKGISPIEHFIGLVDEKTKGGQANLLGQLFGDKQVLEFVRPMLADFKDYIRIRGDAERASGTVADAYARRMEDANERIKSFRIQMENLGTSIGRHTLGPIGDAAKYLADVFDTLDSRVTVLHRLKAAADGFIKGMGFESGSLSGAMKEVRDFLFGLEDGGKAADQYGLIFKRFHEWGAAVRDFTESVKDNPLVKFLGEMAGQGFKLMLAATGIGLLAGAVGKLARAMWVLSGASAAVGILKALTGLGGAIFSGLPGLPGGKSPKGTPTGMKTPKGAPGAPATGGVVATILRQIATRVPQIAAGVMGAYGAQQFISETSADNAAEARRLATPRDAERDSMDALARQRSDLDEMREERNAKPDKPVGFFNSPAWGHVEDAGNAVTNGLSAVGSWLLDWDRRMSESFPSLSAPGSGGDAKLVPEIQSLRDAIHQPSGTQNVNVTNQQPRPNITVNVSVSATGMSPADALRKAGSDIAARLESSFSD